MNEFLIFHLYGPMAAWGDIAVGEQRPTASHPSKSAMMGLLAAALGIRRGHEDDIQALNSAYGFGVRVNAPGELLRDYHTSQVPPDKRKAVYCTRREELDADNLYTILSSRDYRTEASYTIALWGRSDDPPYCFTEISQVLKEPQFSLYLGRKSCPIAFPMAPQIIKADTLKSAFHQCPPLREIQTGLPAAKQISYYWEPLEEDKSGLQANATA